MDPPEDIDGLLDTVTDISGLLKRCIDLEKKKSGAFEDRAGGVERRYAELGSEIMSLEAELGRVGEEGEELEKSLRDAENTLKTLSECEHSTRREDTEMVHDLGELEETLRQLEDKLLLLEQQPESWTSNSALAAVSYMGRPRRGRNPVPRDDHPPTTPANPTAVSTYLEKLYKKKPGTALDELVVNLTTPHQRGSPIHVKDCLIRLGYGAKALRSRPKIPTLPSIDLLTLWLYTAHGVDIDELMGFDTPPSGEWDDYTEQHNTYKGYGERTRNGCVFSEVNWAMRELGRDVDGVSQEVEAVLYRWVKFIVNLARLTSGNELDAATRGDTVLYRGFGGQSYESYKAMTQNESLMWPAFSSCALDKTISVSYIDGSAANSEAKPGSAVLFTIQNLTSGWPLWDISQYPDEKELLLPPLTQFRVVSSTEDYEIKSRCLEGLRVLGKPTDEQMKASVVKLEVVGMRRQKGLEVVKEKSLVEVEKIEKKFKVLLGEVDEVVGEEVDNEIRNRRAEMESELRNLEYKRTWLRRASEDRRASITTLTSVDSDRENLEGHLSILRTHLEADISTLIHTPQRVRRFGTTLPTAMMYLKGLAIDLGKDWRFIGEIYKYHGTDPSEGYHTAFTHLKALLEAEYGLLSWPRWRVPSSSLPHQDQEEVVSTVKQLVICYDMLANPPDDSDEASHEIVVNIDLLCEIYSTAYKRLRL